MLVNTTLYHLWPVIDHSEPQNVRPVRGYIAATVVQTTEFDDDVRISILDPDHNVYNSIDVGDMPMFVSAIRAAFIELDIPVEPDEWHDAGGILVVDIE